MLKNSSSLLTSKVHIKSLGAAGNEKFVKIVTFRFSKIKVTFGDRKT